MDLNKNYQKSSWQQQPSSYSNTSYKTSYSSSSKFEDRLPMASNTYIHSSYPLSRSYSEANKIRYESPAPLSTRYISPAPGSVRYNNIVPMYTAPVRYTSPAPVPIRYASPAPVSSRYTSPAPASLTRYSSPAPGLSQLSARRLSDMRPPPPKPRDLPPAPPRPVRRHYPLPPPSFTDAMVAVSKRLRNRSASPVPRYADLQVILFGIITKIIKLSFWIMKPTKCIRKENGLKNKYDYFRVTLTAFKVSNIFGGCRGCCENGMSPAFNR